MRRLTKHSEFTIGLVVIVLFLVAAFGTSNFLTKYNLMNLTKQGAIIGVLAVAVIAVAVILVRKVLLQKDEEDSGDDDDGNE